MAHPRTRRYLLRLQAKADLKAKKAAEAAAKAAAAGSSSESEPEKEEVGSAAQHSVAWRGAETQYFLVCKGSAFSCAGF